MTSSRSAGSSASRASRSRGRSAPATSCASVASGGRARASGRSTPPRPSTASASRRRRSSSGSSGRRPAPAPGGKRIGSAPSSVSSSRRPSRRRRAAAPRRRPVAPMSEPTPRQVLVTGGGRGIGRAMLVLVQEAASLMNAGGRIIALSSLGSQRVIPGYAAIGVSKAALEALTRYLAAELAPRGITVNTVSAGAVGTDVWQAMPDGGAALAAIRARTPGGALVTPEEVADVVFFLASPAAQAIQGQVLTVDGGYSLLA